MATTNISTSLTNVVPPHITLTGSGTNDLIVFTEKSGGKDDRIVQIVGDAAWGFADTNVGAFLDMFPVAANVAVTLNLRMDASGTYTLYVSTSAGTPNLHVVILH